MRFFKLCIIITLLGIYSVPNNNTTAGLLHMDFDVDAHILHLCIMLMQTFSKRSRPLMIVCELAIIDRQSS